MDNNIIAVSWSEYEQFGCVQCGCDYCYGTGISGGGTAPVICGECGIFFVVLVDGLEKSRIGFGNGEDGVPPYPTLQQHPRQGKPKHKYERPDVRPEVGEYWSPRGVGYDLSGFVKSKEAGERIVQIVEKIINKKPNTWLDYRPHEPTWIQVKFQKEDGFDLFKLNDLCKDGIITEEKIRQALKGG
jgi:hypothetical protein